MGEVIPFPRRDVIMDKRTLAQYLGRSTRWVELRTRDGMPSSLLDGRRKYRLSEVEAWLGGDAA